MSELLSSEKRIAVHHWNRHRLDAPLRCPYSESHSLRPETIDDEVVLHCGECGTAVGFVPDYVYEYYEGCKKLGWIRPIPVTMKPKGRI